MKKEQVANVFTISLAAGNSLQYALLSSREVEICTDALVQEAFENNKIISLTTRNLTLKVGDNFKHEHQTIPSSYHIKEIGKLEDSNYKHKYILYSHRLNLTTQYILPCLGISSRDLSYSGALVNCYLTESPEEISLLYRFSTAEYYGQLEKTLSSHPLFLGIDNSIKGFDVITMKVPKEHQDDIAIFYNGKFSKLSDKLKEKIINFHRLNKKDRVFKVLFRDSDLEKELSVKFGCSMEGIELEERPVSRNELIMFQYGY